MRECLVAGQRGQAREEAMQNLSFHSAKCWQPIQKQRRSRGLHGLLIPIRGSGWMAWKSLGSVLGTGGVVQANVECTSCIGCAEESSMELYI